MADLSPPMTATEAAALGGTLLSVPGLVGPPGPAGTSGTRVFLSSAMPNGNNNCLTGDIWINSEPYTAGATTWPAWTVWTYNSQNFFWTVVGTISGPTGPQGFQGPGGPLGPVGSQGAQGSQGVVGAQGSTGPSGGMQGAQGAQGSQGSQGSLPVLGSYMPVTTPTSGRYLHSGGGTGTAVGLTLNQLKLRKIYIPASLTFDRISIYVQSATASAVVRLGIYNCTNQGIPSSLVLDAGTIDASTTGLKEITINQTLSAGVYAIGVAAQSAVCNIQGEYGVMNFFWDSTFAINTTNGLDSFNMTDAVTGALPSSFSAFSMTSYAPRIMLRVA